MILNSHRGIWVSYKYANPGFWGLVNEHSKVLQKGWCESFVPVDSFFFKLIYYLIELWIELGGWGKREKYLPFTSSIPRWPQMSGPDKARSQKVYPVLLHRCQESKFPGHQQAAEWVEQLGHEPLFAGGSFTHSATRQVPCWEYLKNYTNILVKRS